MILTIEPCNTFAFKSKITSKKKKMKKLDTQSECKQEWINVTKYWKQPNCQQKIGLKNCDLSCHSIALFSSNMTTHRKKNF